MKLKDRMKQGVVIQMEQLLTGKDEKLAEEQMRELGLNKCLQKQAMLIALRNVLVPG